MSVQELNQNVAFKVDIKNGRRNIRFQIEGSFDEHEFPDILSDKIITMLNYFHERNIKLENLGLKKNYWNISINRNMIMKVTINGNLLIEDVVFSLKKILAMESKIPLNGRKFLSQLILNSINDSKKQLV